jgi:hypothetical protein
MEIKKLALFPGGCLVQYEPVADGFADVEMLEDFHSIESFYWIGKCDQHPESSSVAPRDYCLPADG